MNAIQLLTDDHRKHEELLERLKSDSSPELYEEFRRELIEHVHIEEEIFYPRLWEVADLSPVVASALEEHTMCMQLLKELDNGNLAVVIRQAKLTLLSDLLLRHIRREEEELFPKVRSLASLEYLKEVGFQMRIQKTVTNPEVVLYPPPDEEKFYAKVRNTPPA